MKTVAAVWLFSQLGTFIGAPIVVWATAEAVTIECHCMHGPDATCPMHRALRQLPNEAERRERQHRDQDE